MLQRAFRTGLIAALLSTVASSSDVSAQTTGSFEVAPRVGIGIPGGDLWRLQDPGIHVGTSVAYYFTPALAVRGEVAGSFLNEIEDSFGNVPAPGMTLIRFGGGLELKAPRSDRQSLPVTFIASLGAGATSASARKTFSDDSTVDFSSTVLTVSGGGEVGWQVKDNLNVFVSFEAHAMWFDKDETAVFATRSPEVAAFDLAWEFPISIGGRIAVG